MIMISGYYNREMRLRAFANGVKAFVRKPFKLEWLLDLIETVVDRGFHSPVNLARREILALCKDAALQMPGLFTLTVPTGGGKILSSMAFALDHAVGQVNSRIIYVIPFSSIIEQTAEIFSNIFGIENVVEHHSSLEPDKETQRSRLAAENWDAPIIVTTNAKLIKAVCLKVSQLSKNAE